MTSTVANSSDDPTGSVLAAAVGPSDFVTDDGSVMILQGASVNPSAGSGPYFDPTHQSQVILAHGS